MWERLAFSSVTLKGKPSWLFFLLAFLVQDGGAHKPILGVKGDAGTQFCLFCKNLVAKRVRAHGRRRRTLQLRNADGGAALLGLQCRNRRLCLQDATKSGDARTAEYLGRDAGVTCFESRTVWFFGLPFPTPHHNPSVPK